VRKGVVSPLDWDTAGLLTLLPLPPPSSLLPSATTLCQLAASPGYEAKLVQDGIVPALVSLSTVTLQLMHVAILTLLHLSCVEERYSKVEEVDDAALQFSGYSLTPEMEVMLLKCLVNLTGELKVWWWW